MQNTQIEKPDNFLTRWLAGHSLALAAAWGISRYAFGIRGTQIDVLFFYYLLFGLMILVEWLFWRDFRKRIDEDTRLRLAGWEEFRSKVDRYQASFWVLFILALITSWPLESSFYVSLIIGRLIFQTQFDNLIDPALKKVGYEDRENVLRKEKKFATEAVFLILLLMVEIFTGFIQTYLGPMIGLVAAYAIFMFDAVWGVHNIITLLKNPIPEIGEEDRIEVSVENEKRDGSSQHNKWVVISFWVFLSILVFQPLGEVFRACDFLDRLYLDTACVQAFRVKDSDEIVLASGGEVTAVIDRNFPPGGDAVKVFEIVTGEEIAKLALPRGGVFRWWEQDIAISPQTQTAAVLVHLDPDALVQILDISGDEHHLISIPEDNLRGAIRYSAEGDWLVVFGEQRLTIIEVANTKDRQIYTANLPEYVVEVHFEEGGEEVEFILGDGRVYRWAFTTDAAPIETDWVPAMQEMFTEAVGIDEKGEWLVAGEVPIDLADDEDQNWKNEILFWNGARAMSVPFPNEIDTSLWTTYTFSPRGDYLVGAIDSHLFVWETESMTLIFSRNLCTGLCVEGDRSARIRSVSVSDTGLVAVGLDEEIQVWDFLP